MLNKGHYRQMLTKIPTTIDRVHWESPYAVQSLATAIDNQLKLFRDPPSEVVIVCIGTDRSTGDSLGPVTGSELKTQAIPGLHVYGTLDEPVHAANLEEQIEYINTNHSGQTIIAIDACLGKAENVGYITAKNGPLRPGTGVNKDLPTIGDMHIIGTVNVGGFMEYLVLQNTRLSLVMNMARVLSSALSLALRNYLGYAEASASTHI